MKKAILLLFLFAPVASGLVATEKKKTVVPPELQQEIIGYIPKEDVPEKTPISKITNLLLEIRRFEDQSVEKVVFREPETFKKTLKDIVDKVNVPSSIVRNLKKLRTLYEKVKKSGGDVSNVRMPQRWKYDVGFVTHRPFDIKEFFSQEMPDPEFRPKGVFNWTDDHLKKLVDTLGPRIIRLNIDGQFLTSKMIDSIAKCKNLKKLDIRILSGGQCELFDTEESTIATLKRLPKSLEEISLNSFYFTKEENEKNRMNKLFSKKEGDKLLEKVKKDLPNIKEILVFPSYKS